MLEIFSQASKLTHSSWSSVTLYLDLSGVGIILCKVGYMATTSQGWQPQQCISLLQIMHLLVSNRPTAVIEAIRIKIKEK
jgi:hypothetical protein